MIGLAFGSVYPQGEKIENIPFSTGHEISITYWNSSVLGLSGLLK
jgi:hypothetical protein